MLRRNKVLSSSRLSGEILQVKEITFQLKRFSQLEFKARITCFGSLRMAVNKAAAALPESTTRDGEGLAMEMVYALV
jgi:hypothetical protein